MEHKSTILIVDDEPIGRDTLEALLIAQNYNLAFAGDGPEALSKADQVSPDLILLDVMMPGMDGFEVCRRLREMPILAEVPVIMITALDDRDSRLEGLEAGADDFISKPFDRIELRTRIQTITRLNRFRRLLAERAKFEWVVDQADDGYLLIDEDDQILYANPQARLYLGLPAADDNPIPKTFLTLAKKQYQCEPQTGWETWPRQIDLTLQLQRFLVRPETDTANPFWLQVDVMETRYRAAEKHLIRLRDITTQVTVRNNLWTSHAIVSHKLKTPLTLLTTSLELLDGLFDEDLPMEQRQLLLNRAHNGAIRMKSEIMRIFEYIEAKDMNKPGHGQCNLEDIQAIIEDVKMTLDLNAVDIAYKNISATERVSLRMSRRGVELILWELLSNTQKFHPQQTPGIDITLSKIENSIIIQIADDGLSLSPEQLARIWQPYYQAERGFSGQVPGMGLGLSMVASLVWGAGETCRAFNRDSGSGLVIKFGIPIIEEPAED